ncbi:MAG: hypothetical protein ACRDY4_08310 [Acidimicrobiia bacterium]
MRERRKSHALDSFSLIAGLVFVAIGALVLVDSAGDREVDPRWIVAVLLVGLGLAGVFGSIDWSRPGRRLERELASEGVEHPTDESRADTPPIPQEDR